MGSNESKASMSHSNIHRIQVPTLHQMQVPPQVINGVRHERIDPLCTPDGRQIFQTPNGTQFVRLRLSDYHALIRRMDALDKAQLHNQKVLDALTQHMNALSKDIINVDRMRRQNQMDFYSQCENDGQCQPPQQTLNLHSQQFVQQMDAMNGVNAVNGPSASGQMTSQLVQRQQQGVLPLPQINLNQNGQEQQTWTTQNVLPTLGLQSRQ